MKTCEVLMSELTSTKQNDLIDKRLEAGFPLKRDTRNRLATGFPKGKTLTVGRRQVIFPYAYSLVFY